MIDEDHRFFEGMRYCGSNKPVEKKEFFEKVDSIIRGDYNIALPDVRVIMQNGIKRKGRPTVYDPRMDFSEGEGHFKIGLFFYDTQELEIVRLKPHQIYDDDMFSRMCGNYHNVEYTIDKTDTGAVFDRMQTPVPSKGFMPKGVMDAIKAMDSKIWENWIQPLIYNYNRLLTEVNIDQRNLRLQLKSEAMAYRNAYMRNLQLFDNAGLAQYQKMLDGISSGSSPPKAPNMMPRIMGDDEL
jgi:hypothetical protein